MGKINQFPKKNRGKAGYHIGHNIGLATIMIRIFTPLCILLTLEVAGQNMTREQYIKRFAAVAVEEMNRYRIPASITLAQGILESGDGNSRLAVEANNHFGIKCHDDWTGKTIKHHDDRRNECFRAYRNPNESYRDHSLFLTGRTRYAALFDLKPTDYKGWARGLRKAGYATNPNYANQLINLIERHKLYQYDTDLIVAFDQDVNYSDLSSLTVAYHPNKIKFVRVPTGYTMEQISEELHVSMKKLLKYNELRYDAVVAPGDMLFLQPKKNGSVVKTHRVNSGETMYAISQRYGIKLRRLYERNRMAFGEEPNAGDILFLRGYRRGTRE